MQFYKMNSRMKVKKSEKKHPCLYGKADIDYKAWAWAAKGEKLEIEGKAAKVIWLNLKTYFQREE